MPREALRNRVRPGARSLRRRGSRAPHRAGLLAWLVLLAATPTCSASDDEPSTGADAFAEARERMVREQIAARGVEDARVLAAMRAVPRHAFAPAPQREHAYEDRALPIGHAQTLSQPYVVAFMTEALALQGDERVLEIGTGSGYQAAVLAEIVDRVHTIEIVPELAEDARRLLERLGYGEEVRVRTGDGYRGWPEAAPFDAIVVTAAPDHVPQPLVDQLAPGGRLVLPVGERLQKLVRLAKTPQGIRREELLPVRFVPMTGEAEGERTKEREREDR